jgi:hypothetical protein
MFLSRLQGTMSTERLALLAVLRLTHPGRIQCEWLFLVLLHHCRRVSSQFLRADGLANLVRVVDRNKKELFGSVRAICPRNRQIPCGLRRTGLLLLTG